MFVTSNFFQAAFLSAFVGVEIAEASARAAVTTLSEEDDATASKVGRGSLVRDTRQGMNGFWFYTNFKHLGIYLCCICVKIGSNTWYLLEV